MEFAEQLGAKRYERIESRCGYRNGYRERQPHTRVGTLTAHVPRDREGRSSTRLFECCQRSEKALILALQQVYVREDRHVVSEGILTVKGINGQGYREVIGVTAAPGEDGESWGEMFRSLIERGLDPSEVVCATSGDHLGLCDALQRYFAHAAWQRCQAHTRTRFQPRFLAVIVHWRDRVLTFAEWLEETIEDCLSVSGYRRAIAYDFVRQTV